MAEASKPQAGCGFKFAGRLPKMRTHEEAVKLIWDIAELLRGPYRPPQYERVMLPMTVLRRFDCVLEASKAEVRRRIRAADSGGESEATIERLLQKKTGYRFHNHSKFDFRKLLGDPDNLAQHLESYIQAFPVTSVTSSTSSSSEMK